MDALSLVESVRDEGSSSPSRVTKVTEYDPIQTRDARHGEAFGEAYQTSRKRREELNAHAPIHQLPNEILAYIFKLSMDALDYEHAWQRIDLASVCRHWLSLVENSPTLWTTVTNHDNPASVSKSLGITNLKLDVLGKWYHTRAGTGEQWQDDFLDGVISRSERWRSLDLELGRGQIAHQDPLNTPNLEHLSLVVPNKMVHTDTLRPFPILSTGMANLRYLHLERVAVPWDGINTPLLSTLILKDMPTLGPSLSQLFDLLSTCPRLATLHIDAIEGLVQIPHTNSANLPQLQDLVLIFIPSDVIKCIMEFLHGPPYHSEPPEPGPLVPEHPSIDYTLFTTAKRAVLDVSRIVITCDWNSIRFFSDGQCKLSLDMGGMRAAEKMLVWFHDATKSCHEEMPPVRLELNHRVYYGDSGDLRRIATFSCITYLKIGKYNANSIPTIQYLSGTRDLGSKSLSWPFSGLEELYSEFPHHSLVQSIAEMITARQMPNDTEPPASLRRIILGGDDEPPSKQPFSEV